MALQALEDASGKFRVVEKNLAMQAVVDAARELVKTCYAPNLRADYVYLQGLDETVAALDALDAGAAGHVDGEREVDNGSKV